MKAVLRVLHVGIINNYQAIINLIIKCTRNLYRFFAGLPQSGGKVVNVVSHVRNRSEEWDRAAFSWKWTSISGRRRDVEGMVAMRIAVIVGLAVTCMSLALHGWTLFRFQQTQSVAARVNLRRRSLIYIWLVSFGVSYAAMSVWLPMAVGVRPLLLLMIANVIALGHCLVRNRRAWPSVSVQHLWVRQWQFLAGSQLSILGTLMVVLMTLNQR